MLNSLVLTCCILGLGSGMIAVREGYKNIHELYPQYKDLKVEDVKAKLQEEIPGVEFKEFEQPQPGEFFYGKVGLVVRDGVVVEDPIYFTSKKIVEDWTPYIGRPWETVMEELEKQEGLDGVKFVMLYSENDKKLYDNRAGSTPFVLLRVDEHGDIQPPTERSKRAIV